MRLKEALLHSPVGESGSLRFLDQATGQFAVEPLYVRIAIGSAGNGANE
jgi:hypothetical protein